MGKAACGQKQRGEPVWSVYGQRSRGRSKACQGKSEAMERAAKSNGMGAGGAVAAEGRSTGLLVCRSSVEKKVGVYMGSAAERGAKQAR